MRKNIAKKMLILVSMLVFCFSLTACATPISNNAVKKSTKEIKVEASEKAIEEWASAMILYLNSQTTEQIKQQAENSVSLNEIFGKQFVINQDGVNAKTVEFYNSWAKSRSDLGKLVSIDSMKVETSSVTGTLCVVTVNATYEQRSCVFELTINDKYELEGGAINPNFTMLQKVGKALINTLIGSGTVFLVLIFMSFVISLLQNVNKIGKKKETDAPAAAPAPAVSATVEEVIDDTELIAVIAAAIAAQEGVRPDQLVVRSIRKSRRR